MTGGSNGGGGGGRCTPCSSTKFLYVTLAVGALAASLLAVPFTAQQHPSTLSFNLVNTSAPVLPLSGNHKPGTGQLVDVSQWLYRGHPREFVGFKRNRRDTNGMEVDDSLKKLLTLNTSKGGVNQDGSESVVARDIPLSNNNNNITNQPDTTSLLTTAVANVSIATVAGLSPPSTIARVVTALGSAVKPMPVSESSVTSEGRVVIIPRSNSSDVGNYSSVGEVNVNSSSAVLKENGTNIDVLSTTPSSTAVTKPKAKKPNTNGGTLDKDGADGKIIRGPILIEVKKTVPPPDTPDIIVPLASDPSPVENTTVNTSTPQVENSVDTTVDINTVDLLNTDVDGTTDSLGSFAENVTMKILNDTNNNENVVTPIEFNSRNTTTLFKKTTDLDSSKNPNPLPDSTSVPKLLKVSGTTPTARAITVTHELATPPASSTAVPAITTKEPVHSASSVTSINHLSTTAPVLTTTPTQSKASITSTSQPVTVFVRPVKQELTPTTPVADISTTVVHGQSLTTPVSNSDLTPSRSDAGLLTTPTQVQRRTPPDVLYDLSTSGLPDRSLTSTRIAEKETVNGVAEAIRKIYRYEILNESTGMRYLVWIIAVVAVCAAAGLALAWFRYDRASVGGDASSNLPLLPSVPSHRDITPFDSSDSLATLDTSSLPATRSVSETGRQICTFLFYTLCLGIESTFVNLVPSFVTSRFLWSLTEGAMVCVAFWVTYTGGRVISSACVALSRRAVVQTISSLVAALFVVACEVMLLISWGGGAEALPHKSGGVVIWYAAGVVGFALSLIPPFTSENNVDQTNTAVHSDEYNDSIESGSSSFEKTRQSNAARKSRPWSSKLLWLSPGTAEILFPTMTAVLMSSLGPDWFVHSLALLTVLSLVCRVFLQCITARQRRAGARYAPLSLHSGGTFLGAKSSVETLSVDEGEEYDNTNTREDVNLLAARTSRQEGDSDTTRGRAGEVEEVVGSNGVGGGRVFEVAEGGRRISPSRTSPTLVQAVMRTMINNTKAD